MTKTIHAAALAFAVLTLAAVSGCGTDNPQTLIAKAQEYRQKNSYRAAIIELKNVIQKNPDHAEARYLLGVTYNDVGDYRAAEQELRRALALRYDPNKVIPALGTSLVRLAEFKKVLDEVNLQPDASSPVQAEILTLRALASIGLGRVSEGREMLEQALSTQPEFAGALLGKAGLAVSERKLGEATRLLERALASAPTSIDAWLMKGDLSRIAGDQAGAVAAFQKVLDLNPDNVPARLNIASLLIAGGKFDQARKEIEQLRKITNSPMVNYMHALLEFHQKNDRAAREAIQQALKSSPDHVPSMLLAGSIDLRLGFHAQAQAHLGRVLERTPGNLAARKLLISSLSQSGQAQRAIEVLQPALSQAPEDGALMALAGEVYMQTNEFAKAAQYYERAVKAEPRSSEARTKLGLSRMATGETDRALADLEAAVQLEPAGRYQADILLVMSHLNQKNYDQALKAVGTLEKKQPNNPVTHNLKAAIYLGKKDTASGRKHLERALELQPTYVAAAMNLAQLDLQEKNPQAARRRLEAVLEKDKGNLQALLGLAELGPHIGATHKEQIDWLERARKANPSSVAPGVMLAALYLQIGDTRKALDAARQAQAIAPDNPKALEILGMAQSRAGDKEQAVTTFGKLVALQPKSPGALFLLAGAQVVNADPTSASSTLKRALTLKPDFLDAQVMLTGLEVRAGNFPEAIRIARQIQKQAAKSPSGLILEGDVLMAEKKFLQAAKAYETAYGMGKSGMIAVKIHSAYTQAGKPQEAEAQLAKWLKETPGDNATRLYAANAELRKGRYKEAISQYEWLQAKQQENILVLNNLAWAYHQVKDPRALETAERAYKLQPENAAVADTLGWILVEQGATKRGLELLQKAVIGAPNAPEIRYHLAQAWLKAGDKSKGRDELERLLATGANFPQQAEAQALLKQLR